jgi:hypothetical protein
VSFASLVIMSTWAMLIAAVAVVAVAVVIDARSALASFDGVPGVAVEPETAPYHQGYVFGPISTILMLGGGGFGRCVEGVTPRSRSERLARGGSLHLLCPHRFE